MGSSPEALGQVVRDLRRKKGLTQEKLGHDAGYNGGAGVSISRFESGQLVPSPELFEGIARELDISPDELVALAEERSKSPQSAIRDGRVSIESRVAQIGRENHGRKQLVTDLAAFNEARDRAKDDFLMRFREIAARVDGAPPPDPAQLESQDIPERDDAEAEAAYQIQFTRYGVEQALAGTAGGAAAGVAIGDAAAYRTFTEAVALGTASTGAAIPGLTGVAAALNGFGAAMRVGRPAARGASTAGGNAVLAGIVAGTVAVALGGLLSMAKRNRKQQQELAAKLDEVEAEIAETQPNVDALREFMPRATEILEYIAVHAGHALIRWEAEIGQGPIDMQSLEAGEPQRYQDFVEIAAAQLAVATIDFQDLMTNRGSELERATALADAILNQSRKVITSHV